MVGSQNISGGHGVRVADNNLTLLGGTDNP